MQITKYYSIFINKSDTVSLLLQLINNPDKDAETRVQCQTILPLALSFEKRMRQCSNTPSESVLQEFDSCGK